MNITTEYLTDAEKAEILAVFKKDIKYFNRVNTVMDDLKPMYQGKNAQTILPRWDLVYKRVSLLDAMATAIEQQPRDYSLLDNLK